MKREYAAQNPYTGKPMAVPENSLQNALKLVELVTGTKVLTRTVTEWGEWNPPLGDLPKLDHMRLLLGKNVSVTISRDGAGENNDEPVVVTGTLLAFEDSGEVTIRHEDGFVTYAWPALEAEEAA